MFHILKGRRGPKRSKEFGTLKPHDASYRRIRLIRNGAQDSVSVQMGHLCAMQVVNWLSGYHPLNYDCPRTSRLLTSHIIRWNDSATPVERQRLLRWLPALVDCRPSDYEVETVMRWAMQEVPSHLHHSAEFWICVIQRLNPGFIPWWKEGECGDLPLRPASVAKPLAKAQEALAQIPKLEVSEFKATALVPMPEGAEDSIEQIEEYLAESTRLVGV